MNFLEDETKEQIKTCFLISLGIFSVIVGACLLIKIADGSTFAETCWVLLKTSLVIIPISMIIGGIKLLMRMAAD